MTVKFSVGRGPLASVLAVAALSACGGGGSSEPTPVPPAPEKALALTASNYQAAAQQAVTAGNYLMTSGDLLSGAQASAAPSAMQAAVQQFPGLLKQFKRPALVAGAVINESEPCSGGGKIDITTNDINNNGQADEGDSGVMVFSACKEDGVVTAGRMEIKLLKLIGVFDSSSFSAVFTMKLDNFSVTTPIGSTTGQGELKLSIGATSPKDSSIVVEAASFSSNGRLGTVDYQQTMSDFAITSVSFQDKSQVFQGAGLRGTLSGSALEGKTIGIETPISLLIPAALDHPTAGKVVIKGAANSVVQMTVQPNGRVLIELDADGNGSFETSVNKAWSELN
ncbi:hypothetical protein [Roseateles sp.]|uniref:hypothetical protein n=1 Tax=Roseateles sp. TaxID=1971397 RepID=UPI00286D60B5|nr:hypothetical protein [Roseateles sp.]